MLGGLRVTDPVELLEVEYLTDPAAGTTETRLYADFTWRSRRDEPLAQYQGVEWLGIITSAPSIRRSWYDGEAVGGRSTSDIGEARLALLPAGSYGSQRDVLDDEWAIQGRRIKYLFGDRSWLLSQFRTLFLTGDQVRGSDDGRELVLDFADEGTALDDSVLLDKFQGIGEALRHDRSEFSTIPSAAALNPTTSFVVDVSYALSPGAAPGGDVLLLSRVAAPGGHLYRMYVRPVGNFGFAMRSSTGDVFLDATDVPWIADGRYHRVALRWNGALLEAFHSTRTGGFKSALSTGVSTIDTSTFELRVGDSTSGLSIDGWCRIGDVRVAIDTALTDDQIIDRMKRPLTTAEIADYEAYLPLREGSGPTSADETGNGHLLTLGTGVGWVNSFEGSPEMAGRAWPVALGRIRRAPVVWIVEGLYGAVHGRCLKGVQLALEGARRLVIGWPKTVFFAVTFTAATKIISLDAREDFAAVSRLDAQPGFSGLQAGQKIVVTNSVSNNGTFTVAADTDGDSIQVVEALVDESGDSTKQTYIEALNDASLQPDLLVHFYQGVVEFKSPPFLPVQLQLLGDIGREAGFVGVTPAFHFPDYTVGIMDHLVKRWVENPPASSPIFSSAGAALKDAGVWVNPASDRLVRQVLDEGASSIWGRWGWNVHEARWTIFIVAIPTGAAGRSLTEHEWLSMERAKTLQPAPVVILKGQRNYAPLKDGEVSETATKEDAAAARQEWLEVPFKDPDLALRYPRTPETVKETWLQREEDLRAEAERVSAVLAARPSIWRMRALWYPAEADLVEDTWLATTDQFPEMEAGRKLLPVAADSRQRIVSLWG